VVDNHGRLLAMVSRSDALRWQVAGELTETSLAEALSDSSQPVAYLHTSIGDVADLMVESGVGRIPIVEAATNRVLGILSRHDLLKVRSARKRAEVDRT
jgi:CIC family chloride channel protein